MSLRFGVSVPYFHGGYSEGHFEVRALSSRGSTVSKQYRPTTNEKPSETMFQRVLLDFVLKTFGLGAENETRTRDPNLGKVVLYQLSYFRRMFWTLQSVFLSDCECKDIAKILFSKIFSLFFQKNLFFPRFTHSLSVKTAFPTMRSSNTTSTRPILFLADHITACPHHCQSQSKAQHHISDPQGPMALLQ